ncbi:MAG TPA: hypothetical protein PKN26_01285 [Giesbergeria sp.]|nr:hypothetical protein [Giesbergeria sp.]HNE71326.1 hypothetical protein [Giesbergeria sp.]HNI75053.1 hypothetical protein [Giesbergeria sp.]HNK05009.1 hypothetical protein [Giesbergeria sp.]HNM41370.1 hypothetical protein [Giesbergeria sp.]
MTLTAATSPPDYAAFLRDQYALQTPNVASYRLGSEQVWLKKAGPRHSMARYRVLGLLAWLTRLQVLRPVPNLGGSTAIATEARRLHSLAALGLRVPEVLAQQPEGLLLRHLGRPGEATPSFDGEMQAASAAGPQAVLARWQEGLAALQAVHARGACLSQAFARNLVRCPDGVLGFIDFEDDPLASLPLALCQARDALCYVHSTALYLREAGALPEARAVWAHWLADQPAALSALLATTAQRLAWLRHLPQDRRWGRDLQRARAAYDLLTPSSHTVATP